MPTAVDVTRLAPVVKANGTELTAQQMLSLVSLRIERGLRMIGRLTLRFADEGAALAESGPFQLGAVVQVTAQTGKILFSGKVTAASLEFTEARTPAFTVLVDDAAVALTRGSLTHTYTKMTYADVIGGLARDAGLSASVSASTPSFLNAYLMRAGTALRFIDDIAERTGCDWYVGGADAATFVFAPPDTTTAPVATLTVGETLQTLTVRAGGHGPTAVQATGWQPTTQSVVTPQAGSASESSAPSAAAMSRFRKGSDLGASSAISASFNPLDGTEAQSIATALQQRASAASIAARGSLVTVEPSLVPGANVTIAGAGPANGTYPITSVEHSYSSAGFVTRFAAGARQPATLVDTLGHAGARNSFVHEGLLTGIVTNNNDSEGYGRLQVMLNGIQSADTTAWARLATPGAGSERGLIVLPEVGDEVLIGFEQGDIRRPVVLGGLYGDSGKLSSYGLASGAGSGGGDVQTRSLISRLGYRVETIDGSGDTEQAVRMSLQDDDTHTIRLGKDKIQVVAPSQVPIEIVAGGSSIKIDKDGNIALTGKKITIAAQQDVTITSQTGKVEATASAGQLNLSGMSFALKGSSTGEVNGGGTTAVKGGTVMIN
jgi:uncharacterized protein involved in type VI secretion and phage assembly